MFLCHSHFELRLRLRLRLKWGWVEVELKFSSSWVEVNPIIYGIFSPGWYRGVADSDHHFETLARASLDILTSFESIPLVRHERRPRIQKMKFLAEKLTKWQRIEKLWQRREIEIFLKIERFALCKSCYLQLIKWLSFCPRWSNLAETGLYGFVIRTGEKLRSANNTKFRGITEFPSHGQIRPFGLT